MENTAYSISNKLSSWFQNNMMPEKHRLDLDSRILSFDFIKLLAAFLTVFYHFAHYRLDFAFSAGMPYSPNLARIVMSAAAAGVPLFFMVNGSLILAKERSVKSLLNKIFKILILIVVWKFVYFPSWFFKTLCILYVLTPVFQFVYRKHRPVYYLICTGIFFFPFLYNSLVLIVRALHIESMPFAQLERTGFFTMYSILYFLLGPLLASRAKPVSWEGSALLIGAGLFLLTNECTIYTNLDNTMFDGVNASFPTIGALLLSVGLFVLCQRFSFRNVKKPLLWLSKQILPIYLFHLFVINKLYFLPFDLSLCMSLLLSAVILLICATIGKLLSYIPVICWFLKI